MTSTGRCDVPDVGGYEMCHKKVPLCVRVGFVQFVYNDDTRTITRRGNTCGPDWTSAPLDTPVRQLVADGTHVAVLCERSAVTVFRAFTGDVVYRHVRHHFGLLAIDSSSIVGVVRLQVQEDYACISWVTTTPEADDADFVPVTRNTFKDADAVTHTVGYVNAVVLHDRLYVLCTRRGGEGSEIVVYKIDGRLVRMGTLLLPADKGKYGVRLMVGEHGVFLAYSRLSALWRVPLELCDLESSDAVRKEMESIVSHPPAPPRKRGPIHVVESVGIVARSLSLKPTAADRAEFQYSTAECDE